MTERVPPAVVVFVGSTWVTQRPKLLARLPQSITGRVPFIRYDPDSDFEAAFVDEVRQKIAQAANHLLPELAPALPVLLVVDPLTDQVPVNLPNLLCRACPAQLSLSLQWIGVDQPEAFPTWEFASRTASATFLLSTTSRHGLLQGAALEGAFQALLLTFIATEVSRFSAPGWNSFTSLRFGQSGRFFITSIDHVSVPDFHAEALAVVEAAVANNYLPEITEVARFSAAARAPKNPEMLLSPPGTRAVFEANLAEPLLCAAIARSLSLDQALAHLSGWAAMANAEAAAVLEDLQVGLRQWMVKLQSHPLPTIAPSLAAPLFENTGFPAMHSLHMPLTARPTISWKELIENTRSALVTETRSLLDARHYEYLPHDLSHVERALRVSRSSGMSAGGTLVYVTQHRPEEVVGDMRHEILHVRDMSTVLYFMEHSAP
jgi:hypothetical protein